MTIKVILILFSFLMMPLRIVACEPFKQAQPRVGSEVSIDGNRIPQEYLIGFPQLTSDNRTRDLVVSVRSPVLDILEDDRDMDERRHLNRAGPMPFFCGLFCASMAVVGIILIIKKLSD